MITRLLCAPDSLPAGAPSPAARGRKIATALLSLNLLIRWWARRD